MNVEIGTGAKESLSRNIFFKFGDCDLCSARYRTLQMSSRNTKKIPEYSNRRYYLAIPSKKLQFCICPVKNIKTFFNPISIRFLYSFREKMNIELFLRSAWLALGTVFPAADERRSTLSANVKSRNSLNK
jgi:hypothetical protein